jgi:hypothetical protein
MGKLQDQDFTGQLVLHDPRCSHVREVDGQLVLELRHCDARGVDGEQLTHPRSSKWRRSTRGRRRCTRGRRRCTRGRRRRCPRI